MIKTLSIYSLNFQVTKSISGACKGEGCTFCFHAVLPPSTPHLWCGLKKYSQAKSWELCFIQWEFLGLKAGGSIPANPRERLWGGEGRRQITWKFCDKGQVVWTSKDYCWLKKFRYPTLRNLALFFVREHAGLWLTETIPLRCASPIWGWDPVFSYPEFPWGSPTHMTVISSVYWCSRK